MMVVIMLKKDSNQNDKTIKSSNRKCLFCGVSNHSKAVKIIAQYNHCYVMEDNYPVSKGHLLIISKDHVENWFAASFKVKTNMIKALDEMKASLDKRYQPGGYNIGMNCGIVAGQSINHLHIHLIPRYQNDVEDPRGGVRGVIPSKQKY